MKVDKPTVDFLKDQQKRNAERQDRVVSEYYRLVKDRSDEEVIPELMERFGIKNESTIQRWLQKRSGSLNPAAKAVSDVMILTRINSLLSKAEEYNALLERKIEDIEESPEEWVRIEQTDSERQGITTKAVSKFEALKSVMKERISTEQEFFKSIRSLMPQTVLNQVIDNRKTADHYSDEELDRLLEINN